MQIQKTYVSQVQSPKVERTWYVIDLKGQRLGRISTQIAMILRGKNKPTYTSHVDGGDFVIAINADEIALTGNKWLQKIYYRHSGYPGGLKKRTALEMKERSSAQIIELAVEGMLPKGVLGKTQFRRLRVYTGAEHPHQAQKPQTWVLGNEVKV